MKYEDIKVGEKYFRKYHTIQSFEEAVFKHDETKSVVFLDDIGELWVTDYLENFTKLEEKQWMIGKAYKSTDKRDNCMFLCSEINSKGEPLGYGFINGEWISLTSQSWAGNIVKDYKVASIDDWYEAIQKEALKRGFKLEGKNKFLSHWGLVKGHTVTFDSEIYNFNRDKLKLHKNNSSFTIYEGGKWAEIVEDKVKTITLSQFTGDDFVTINGVKYVREDSIKK